MALDPRSLRKLFALGAVLAALIAAGFYLRSIIKSSRTLARIPASIPENIARSGKGFTYSQSEGGRTLFTIHAANFQQYKAAGRAEGGKAELHDVSIIVYGRQDNRSDQIYGSDFVYDPESGDVTANGEVRIDLQADATVNAANGQGPPADNQNLIHVKTSGLTFNRKSGIASTREKIEFRIPGASGSALGARYDSHDSVLSLRSAVKIVTTEKQAATITGRNASISRDPRQIVLQGARVEQRERTISADKVTILLREDSSVESVSGAGNVHAVQPGTDGFEVNSPQADLFLSGGNQARSAAISGGVTFERRGDSPARGRAGKILVTFGRGGKVSHAKAVDAVNVTQGVADRSQELKASALDLFVRNGRRLEKAVTSSGRAEILVGQQATRTSISAGHFEAYFTGQNQLSRLTGSPDAKLISKTPGQPDRVAGAREFTAHFDRQGQIASAQLQGNFQYREGQRTATAAQAHFNVADESYTLTGSPRVVDSGVALTADTISLSRQAGAVRGEGNVKTTYNNLRAVPNGAMLGASEPIHVTGSSVTASRDSGVAVYTMARLWQGTNMVEAPRLSFDKTRRSLEAQGTPKRRVSTVFVQADKSGKTTPVTVTADTLDYQDTERQAVFSGKVLIKSAETTMDANTVQVFLLPRGNTAGGNQLDRIVAEGDIQIEQKARKAVGSKVIYTASDQKFVLTGTEGRRPSIFDAEHGQITGDSLTFYTQGDRVLVGSGSSSPTLTQNRNRDASKK
jgi:lipopolysaccharide export system protein LptA